MWLASENEIEELVPYEKTNNHSLSNRFTGFILGQCIEGFSPSMIAKNEHGKPVLKGVPFSYNLSHCDNLFALLVTSFPFCGVDVQSVKDIARYEDALRSVFTDREYAILEEKGTPGDFFQLWSLKEAYVKALGGSIWYGRDFDSSTEPGCYSDKWFQRGGLSFFSTEIEKDVYLSLAVPSLSEDRAFRKMRLKDFS